MIGTNENMVMPVAPYMGGCNNGFGNGNDWGDWLVLLILFGCFNGGWGGFGNGNNQLGYDFPWLMNSNNRTLDAVTTGFDNSAVMSQLGDIQGAITGGFANNATALCSGFANINAAITGAQNSLSQQLYTNQIADMNQRFTDTLAQTNQMNNLAAGLQNCCCENRAGLADVKYTIATENCADRQVVSDGIRDLLAAQASSTQKILDQLCQDKIDAKNEEIARLRQEVAMKDLAASQTAQNAFIAQGFSNEVDNLYNRLNSCPVSTVPVFGKQPIFTCGNGSYAGCGCGA